LPFAFAAPARETAAIAAAAITNARFIFRSYSLRRQLADLGYFDDDRDGRLSRGEFVDKPNPLFARYDKKGTCRVTLDDIANASEKTSKSRTRR
jgi:hypothetical protein